jgi:flagellar M-ring protein FliF
MDQLKNLLSHLSRTQQITIVLAAVLVFAGIYGFANWRRESDFRPLYTGMAPEDAGVVVQKLKEFGSEYRLAENGATVLVPSAKLPELRLSLAAAGLPKSGRAGFELFDKTNFGATEFVEHINYQRALEGELERSIASLAEIEQARVHLTFARQSVYLDNQQPAKASVLLRLRANAHLSPQSVTAISQLVASAVEGLTPDAVSILDMRGGLLSRRPKPAEVEQGNEMLEYRRKVEQDLLAKINTTLEPLLGPDRFRAGVSVECDFSNSEETSEVFDPDHSVMVSSEKTEDSSTTAGAAGGMPGTASNLPRPAAKPAASSPNGLSRRTENVTYQTSRTTRRVRQPQGVIKHVSVSVLLDHNIRWEGKKKVVTPPTPEMLKSIREVVAGVAAISEDRGDQLVVESLPFESTMNPEPEPALPPAPSWRRWLQDPLSRNVLILAGLLLLVAAGLAFGLYRSVARTKHVIGVSAPSELPEPEMAPGPDAILTEASLPPPRNELEPAALQVPELEPVPAMTAEELLQRIRELAAKNAAAPAGVVRMWLSQRGA